MYFNFSFVTAINACLNFPLDFVVHFKVESKNPGTNTNSTCNRIKCHDPNLYNSKRNF